MQTGQARFNRDREPSE
jgi:two-component sensor histidine kinase